MSSPPRRVRVAIVGGGCAALTTAFELSSPVHDGRYEVTIYQQGWRLGGKGASGRGMADRVEEHGLHLWMGFYENAFRLMRDCYAERHAAFPNCRFAHWEDAFKPAPTVGVADRGPNGWEFWLAHFRPGQGQPGDPVTTGSPFTVLAYMRQSVSLIGELLRSADATSSPEPAPDHGRGQTTRPGAMADPAAGVDAVARAIEAVLRYGQLATTTAVIEACELLKQAVDEYFPQMFREGAELPMRLIDGLVAVARVQLQRQLEADSAARRVWQVIDLILAALRGSVVSGLALDPRGFDAINDYDWREWLRLHGASEPSLDSGFMRGIYDLAFAFEEGDVTRPRLAAGVALRGAVRMFFTYRGALFWRMSAGMGDVVFAPLYQVLKRRGVRFEFFHRLRHVALSPASPGAPSFVESLLFDVQARVKGAVEYEPLIEVHKVPSWPSRPDYGQLESGRRLEKEGRAFEAIWEERRAGRKTLRVTEDFDFVVLGVSVAALPDVARELIEREPRWREMIRHVKTVSTQAFQLWLREDARALGWPHATVNLSGFVEPFDTWADMTHLAAEESWRDPVRSIAYFCSVLPDAEAGSALTARGHGQQRARVRANAVRFLERDIAALWPRAIDRRGAFRWDLLITGQKDRPAAGERASARRFDAQFWTANVNPTDRYVLSLPGSIGYRVSPLDMAFDNLTIAGDWTATGLDTGCIESAVMSGRLAAHAIAGVPALEDIVGYDHP